MMTELKTPGLNGTLPLLLVFLARLDARLVDNGRYSAPVKDFNYGRQPDLEAAYRATAAVRDLPFAFGYHWRQGTSSVMLAIRTAGVR
jgi:hypothetical protein